MVGLCSLRHACEITKRKEKGYVHSKFAESNETLIIKRMACQQKSFSNSIIGIDSDQATMQLLIDYRCRLQHKI